MRPRAEGARRKGSRSWQLHHRSLRVSQASSLNLGCLHRRRVINAYQGFPARDRYRADHGDGRLRGAAAAPDDAYYDDRARSTRIAAAITIAIANCQQCGRVTDVERVYAHDRSTQRRRRGDRRNRRRSARQHGRQGRWPHGGDGCRRGGWRICRQRGRVEQQRAQRTTRSASTSRSTMAAMQSSRSTTIRASVRVIA